MKFTPTVIFTALAAFATTVAAVPPAPGALIERDSLEKRVTHQGMVGAIVNISPPDETHCDITHRHS